MRSCVQRLHVVARSTQIIDPCAFLSLEPERLWVQRSFIPWDPMRSYISTTCFAVRSTQIVDPTFRSAHKSDNSAGNVLSRLLWLSLSCGAASLQASGTTAIQRLDGLLPRCRQVCASCGAASLKAFGTTAIQRLDGLLPRCRQVCASCGAASLKAFGTTVIQRLEGKLPRCRQATRRAAQHHIRRCSQRHLLRKLLDCKVTRYLCRVRHVLVSILHLISTVGKFEYKGTNVAENVILAGNERTPNVIWLAQFLESSWIDLTLPITFIVIISRVYHYICNIYNRFYE